MKFGLQLSPHGRASRKQYASALILSWALAIANAFLVTYIAQLTLPRIPVELQTAWQMASVTWSVIGIWPAWALIIRRCHDVGWSGWSSLVFLSPLASIGAQDYVFLALIPSLIMVALLLFWPGQRRANAYGPNPLQA